MYNQITLLYRWNEHNIVNQLCFSFRKQNLLVAYPTGLSLPLAATCWNNLELTAEPRKADT